MSKNINSELDQYGKVYSLNGIGGERVNVKHQKKKTTTKTK